MVENYFSYCRYYSIVIGFIGMVIKMAVTDAKEETRDIEEASKKKAKE